MNRQIEKLEAANYRLIEEQQFDEAQSKARLESRAATISQNAQEIAQLRAQAQATAQRKEAQKSTKNAPSPIHEVVK